MKVLHLCHAFLGSKVHVNLYTALFHMSVQQIVYYPIRPSSTLRDRNDVSGIETIDGFQLKKYHRIFFRNKIKGIYRDLFTKVDFKHINMVHATTLFSDGAVAYEIFKNHKVPYIVAVRYTDTDFFLKLRPDLFPLVMNILLNAAKIIFISTALKDNFFAHPFIKTFKTRILNKTEVIYNGIDPYWLRNRRNIQRDKPTKILYVGIYDNRKNVLQLIKAFLLLKSEFPKLELNLVGHTGNQLAEIKKIASHENNGVNYLGPIYEKEALLEIYRANHIFAMVSKRETFGLVYLESLSQGLPLVYSKSQGVDGIFKERIGEVVNPYSVNSIKNGLNKILTNYGQYDSNVDFSNFHWPYIAQKYHLLYKEIIQLSFQ